jgi:hypothetical protein
MHLDPPIFLLTNFQERKEVFFLLVAMLNPVILATKETEIGRIVVQGQLRKKFVRPPFQPMAGSVLQPHREAQIKGLQSRPAWA